MYGSEVKPKIKILTVLNKVYSWDYIFSLSVIGDESSGYEGFNYIVAKPEHTRLNLHHPCCVFIPWCGGKANRCVPS